MNTAWQISSQTHPCLRDFRSHAPPGGGQQAEPPRVGAWGQPPGHTLRVLTVYVIWSTSQCCPARSRELRLEAMPAWGESLRCRSVSAVPDEEGGWGGGVGESGRGWSRGTGLFSFWSPDRRRLASRCSCSHTEDLESVLSSRPRQGRGSAVGPTAKFAEWEVGAESRLCLWHTPSALRPSLATPLFGAHGGRDVNSGEGWASGIAAAMPFFEGRSSEVPSPFRFLFSPPSFSVFPSLCL